jgi:hypothetical protein
VEVVGRAIRTLSVEPGGRFEYVTFFRRSKYCDAMVERWFVDSEKQIRNIDPLSGAMRTRNLNVVQRNEASIPVFSDMKPGRSKSCYKSTWKCNPPQRWGILPPIVGPEVCIDFLVEMPTVDQSVGPAGPQGAQGVPGIEGPAGPQGVPGPRGPAR